MLCSLWHHARLSLLTSTDQYAPKLGNYMQNVNCKLLDSGLQLSQVSEAKPGATGTRSARNICKHTSTNTSIATIGATRTGQCLSHCSKRWRGADTDCPIQEGIKLLSGVGHITILLSQTGRRVLAQFRKRGRLLPTHSRRDGCRLLFALLNCGGCGFLRLGGLSHFHILLRNVEIIASICDDTHL